MSEVKFETLNDYEPIFRLLYKDNENGFEKIVSCWNKINELKKEHKDLTTKEGILLYYQCCLLFNQYFIYRNINNEKHKKEIEDCILCYNDLFLNARFENDLLNIPAFEFKLMNLNIREIIFGINSEYILFDCYDMTSKLPFVGIKKILNYLSFTILIERKEHLKAKELAEKSIWTIKFLKREYNSGDNIYEKSLPIFLKNDLELLFNNQVPEIKELKLLLEKVPFEKYNMLVLPTVNLLADYCRVLTDDNYRKFILYIILNMPETDCVTRLLQENKEKKIVENIDEIVRESINKTLSNDEIMNEIHKATNSYLKTKIFDTLEYSFPNIDFDNLQIDTRDYVANANFIYDILIRVLDKRSLDFSLAIMDWCKAVELEFKLKLVEPILKNDDLIKKLNMFGVSINKNQKTVLGLGYPLRKNTRLVYEKVYKNMYKEFNADYFENIFFMVGELNRKFRKDSAHPEGTIDLLDAIECKDMVLSSEKILELLSKLPKNRIYS